MIWLSLEINRNYHTWKESGDSTLGLCNVPKESHGCTGLQTVSFSSVKKSSPIFSSKLQIDPNKSNGSTHD